MADAVAPTVFKAGLNINKPPQDGRIRLCVVKLNEEAGRTELYWLDLSVSSTVDRLCAAAYAAVQQASDSSESTSVSLEQRTDSVLASQQHCAMQLQWDLQCLSPGDSKLLCDLGVPDKEVLKWVQLPPTPIPQQAEEPSAPPVELLYACAPEHVCIPSLPYLRWLAERDPLAVTHTMAHVANFTVLHPAFGAVTWMGASDIRGVDLSEVQLSGAEVLLAPGVLPATAQVVLRGVRPQGKPPVPSFVRGMVEARAVQAVKDAAALAEEAQCEEEWRQYHGALLQACPAFTRMLVGPDPVYGRAADAAGGSDAVSPPTDSSDASFQAQLRAACGAMEAFFVQYDAGTGEWAFNVAPS